MKPIAFAAAILSLAAIPALAKDFKVQNNMTDFDTPGRNICCTFFPDAGYYPDQGHGPLLSCSREEPRYWTVLLRPDGKMKVLKNPDEVPGCGTGEPIGNVLAYGESWQKDRFDCKMAKDGLTCKANGKGFKLSRKGLKTLK